MRKIILVVAICMLSACGWGNKDYVKENAERVFSENGFEIIGYQGWHNGKYFGGSYGGAYVWYTLKKHDSGIIYEAALQRWGDEIHVYALTAKDAISPKN